MLSLALAIATSTAANALPLEKPSLLEDHQRMTAYALFGFAHNPDAVALFAGFEKKHTYDVAEGVLWRELYTDYGAEVLISGLFRPAIFGEWSPIRILKIRAQYDLWLWPGFALGRGHGLIFASKDSLFGPDELMRRKGEEISGVGHRFSIAPTLQLKVWRIALIDTFEAAGWYVHGAPSFWREPLHDTLIARGSIDGTIKNFGLLLLEVWTGGHEERVMVGGSFEIVHSLQADITRQRIGGVVVATPFESIAGLDRPALFVLVGVNAVDRNREGELWINVGLRLDLDVARQ